jgi:surfeit locus 1 family protein
MPRTPAKRFPIGLTLATTIAFAILIGLGVWQIKRLHWKEGLLAKIAALQSAAPVPINSALSGGPLGPEIDFTRVEAVCPDIETSRFITLFTVSNTRPGFRVITACALTGGRYKTVLVDRGFVDQSMMGSLRDAMGRRLDAPIVGVLRRGDLRNFLTPQNDPARNLWYWRDIGAMANSLGAPDPAPTFLMLERPAPLRFGPTPAPLPLDIPNNHLGYALTWFGLAATLIGVYVASLWRRLSD